MACIVIETPAGTKYEWPDNTPRKPIPGEKIIGINWNCSPEAGDSDNLAAIFQKEGIAWGKAIKYVAGKIGLKQCSSCKAREVILDEAQKLGWGETLKRLRETL